MHRHAGVFLENLPHNAFVLGAQVLDDDKGHIAVGRHVSEKRFQGLQPSGRGPDAHHRESFPGLCLRLFGLFQRRQFRGEFFLRRLCLWGLLLLQVCSVVSCCCPFFGDPVFSAMACHPCEIFQQ